MGNWLIPLQPYGLARREQVRRQMERKPHPFPQLRVDPATEYRFRTFALAYYTEVGRVPATLHRVKVSEKTGETVAEYDVVYRQPSTGRLVLTRYLYGWQNPAAAKPTMLREYPPRYVAG